MLVKKFYKNSVQKKKKKRKRKMMVKKFTSKISFAQNLQIAGCTKSLLKVPLGNVQGEKLHKSISVKPRNVYLITKEKKICQILFKTKEGVDYNFHAISFGAFPLNYTYITYTESANEWKNRDNVTFPFHLYLCAFVYMHPIKMFLLYKKIYIHYILFGWIYE